MSIFTTIVFEGALEIFLILSSSPLKKDKIFQIYIERERERDRGREREREGERVVLVSKAFS